MSNQRSMRVAEQIRQELARLIRDELKDPRIGFVSIMKVRVSNDLRYAKVYVSVMGDDQAKKETLEGLTSAAGFLRSELGRVLRLRYTPELQLELDDSIEYGSRIAELLVQVQKEEQERQEQEESRE